MCKCGGDAEWTMSSWVEVVMLGFVADSSVSD